MQYFLCRLAIFLAIFLAVYLGFSFYAVYSSLSGRLYISPDLKNESIKKDNQYVIGIITPNRRGEMQQALMVKEAAEQMGQLTYVYGVNDLDMNLFLPAKFINELIIRYLDYKYKTNFHLVMSFHVNLSLKEPNIMYISVPKKYLLDGKLDQFQTIRNYSNFLDINLLNTKEEMMGQLLDKKVRSAYGLVGVPANSYKTSNRQNLVLFGSIWGRKTDGFYMALNKLAAQDYMYFIKNPLLLLSINSQQKFTENARGLKGLQEVLNKYGMGLCAHSRYHNEAGIPSSRIFEIISSGAIAISDKNPFVMKYFGDNVLYFDPNLSADEIFKTIDGHVKWVRENPEKAEEMARRAHQVIQDNFTTEKFVEDSINFYDIIE
jgi:hypothetical protein